MPQGVPSSIGSYTMPQTGFSPAASAFAKKNKRYNSLMQMYPHMVNKTAAPAQGTQPQQEGFTYNPTTDASMIALTGQYNQFHAKREASDLEKKKQMLLAFGSKELARNILGNDPFVDLISDNPDTSSSTLGQLGYAYRQNQQQFNEQENAGNLFYGGGRGVGLRDLAHTNLIDVANATTTARNQLTGVDDAAAQAEEQWAQNLFSGNLEAYRNWLIARGVLAQ